MKLIQVGKDKRYKLSPKQIEEIRKDERTPQKELAEKYGVCRQRISAIQDLSGNYEKRKKIDAEKDVWRYRNDPKYRSRKQKSKRTVYEKRKEYLGNKYKIYG